MSTLGLNNNTATEPLGAQPTGDHLADCKRVKAIGTLALITAIAGIFVPFIAHIAAFIIAKWTMRLSRNKLVPIEYERPAYWAYRISIIGILWWVIIVFRFIT